MRSPQAENPEGLEIISIGSLYKGSSWDKKYWSSSRGKDRYPYPIGYHAVRIHNGITHKMEICEGPKGPLFRITSTDGESCSGHSPDMVWESFQKKSAPRSKLGNGKRFSCKIDGVEFFGFRNALVQRMLRELVSNINGTAERDLLSTSSCNKTCIIGPAAQSLESCKVPDFLQPTTKTQSTKKRSRKEKVAREHAATGPELEKYKLKNVSDNAESSITRKENDKHYNAMEVNEVVPDLLLFITKPQSTKKRSRKEKVAKTHAAAVEMDKVVERRNNSFSVKDGSTSERPADPLVKDANLLQEQKFVGSEDFKLTSLDIELSKGEKKVSNFSEANRHGIGEILSSIECNGVNSLDLCAPDSLDLLLGSPSMQQKRWDRRNFSEANKYGTGELMSSIECKGVNSLDLCAPDSLDLLQDNVSNFVPECKKVSPCQVKNEEMVSLHREDEIEKKVSPCLVKDEEMVGLHGEDKMDVYPSSGSSEKSNDDSDRQELANSMMTLLLPQALPLLKKTSSRKRSKVHTSDTAFVHGDTCLNLAGKRISDETIGMCQNANTLSPGKTEVGMLAEGFPKDREVQLQCFKTNLDLDFPSLDNLKSVVPDSFEDEQVSKHPNYEMALCSDLPKNDEALSDNIDCYLRSSSVRKTSSSAHVGIPRNNKVSNDKVQMLHNDNLKKDEVLKSGSHLRFLPAKSQIHLKGQSEKAFMRSDKTKICRESTVNKFVTKDPGPIKDSPAIEQILVTHDETEPIRGESCILPKLSVADKHSAEMAAATSDMTCLEKVLPPKTEKSIENMSGGSSNNNIVQYTRRQRSTGKKYQSSQGHENQDSVATEQICAARDLIDVNAIASVSSVHMSEKEVVIEKKDNVDSNISSSIKVLGLSGLLPNKRFRVPFSENLIRRGTKENCLPEKQTSLNNIVRLGSSAHTLHRKVSPGSEVKSGGRYRQLATKIETIRCNGIDSQAQAVVDDAKGNAILDQDKHHMHYIKDCKDTSVQVQDRQEKSYADDNMHDTKENLVNLNLHPQFKSATRSGQHSGNLFSHTEVHKKCLLPNQYFSLDTKLSKTPEDLIQLVGCYTQPARILSVVVLNRQGDDVHISVLCGILTDRLRTLFIYKVPLKNPRRGFPAFLGYTSIMLPTSKYSFSGEIAFERFPLHFTPNGQWLIFSTSFKAPYCRDRNIHCSCSLCTTNCFQEKAVNIIHVKLGYISLVAMLKTEDSVQSILVCEPNHLAVLEKNGRMKVWVMNSLWSERVEEFILPSLDHLSPCIMELKKNPRHPSLVIGHNGFGDFGLWDISKRIILSKFSSPHSCILHFHPIGLFGWKRGPARARFNVEEQIKGIMAASERCFSKVSDDVDLVSFSGEDIAVWLLVSVFCDSEVHYDHQANDFNMSQEGSWRLALLVDNMMIMGSTLDPRASLADVLDNCGIISTHDGLLYIWELSTGRKLADLHHFESGRVSCVSTDPKAGVLAVAGDENQLLVYTVPRPLHSQPSAFT